MLSIPFLVSLKFNFINILKTIQNIFNEISMNTTDEMRYKRFRSSFIEKYEIFFINVIVFFPLLPSIAISQKEVRF